MYILFYQNGVKIGKNYFFQYFFQHRPLLGQLLYFYLIYNLQYYMWPFVCCCRAVVQQLLLRAVPLLTSAAAIMAAASCCSLLLLLLLLQWAAQLLLLLRAALAAPLQGLPQAAPLLVQLLHIYLGQSVAQFCPRPGSNSRTHHWHLPTNNCPRRT